MTLPDDLDDDQISMLIIAVGGGANVCCDDGTHARAILRAKHAPQSLDNLEQDVAELQHWYYECFGCEPSEAHRHRYLTKLAEMLDTPSFRRRHVPRDMFAGLHEDVDTLCHKGLCIKRATRMATYYANGGHVVVQPSCDDHGGPPFAPLQTARSEDTDA